MTPATAQARPYVGRFAPSPTGPLHAGSLVAALGSWLDARAHGGQWRVRIEDVDTPRCSPQAAQHILAQLSAAGLHPDGEVIWQSTRHGAYDAALNRLRDQQRAYGCACSRSDLARSAAHADAALVLQPAATAERAYPGTCRSGTRGRPARAWRLRLPDGPEATVIWHDRRLGAQQQRVDEAVGDFVLRRADGFWAYQLAVVVDDGDQGVTDVVRGEDLADNTPRQILLQQALGLPAPRYLHLPLVRNAAGDKLSKQTLAPGLDLQAMRAALDDAAAVLSLQQATDPALPLADALQRWVCAWRSLWAGSPPPTL